MLFSDVTLGVMDQLFIDSKIHRLTQLIGILLFLIQDAFALTKTNFKVKSAPLHEVEKNFSFASFSPF